MNAKDTYAYISRGYTRQKLQDYKGAMSTTGYTYADANYVIQLNPKEAEAYLLRSQIRRHLGDNQGAIADEQTGNTLFKAMDEEDRS
ncbi:MAG: hypothetical protein V7K94_07610 [Nostoc sp.]|uniref:hypothetical protein n=1 Tax=Nostoc sp. TaxID=1180 RepID=UPI002FF9AD9D